MLLLAGDAESPSFGQPQQTCIASERPCSEVQEIIYPGIGHMGIMLALAPGFRGAHPCAKTSRGLSRRIDVKYPIFNGRVIPEQVGQSYRPLWRRSAILAYQFCN